MWNITLDKETNLQTLNGGIAEYYKECVKELEEQSEGRLSAFFETDVIQHKNRMGGTIFTPILDFYLKSQYTGCSEMLWRINIHFDNYEAVKSGNAYYATIKVMSAGYAIDEDKHFTNIEDIKVYLDKVKGSDFIPYVVKRLENRYGVN
jgi:hypothetical protein